MDPPPGPSASNDELEAERKELEEAVMERFREDLGSPDAAIRNVLDALQNARQAACLVRDLYPTASQEYNDIDHLVGECKYIHLSIGLIRHWRDEMDRLVGECGHINSPFCQVRDGRNECMSAVPMTDGDERALTKIRHCKFILNRVSEKIKLLRPRFRAIKTVKKAWKAVAGNSTSGLREKEMYQQVESDLDLVDNLLRDVAQSDSEAVQEAVQDSLDLLDSGNGVNPGSPSFRFTVFLSHAGEDKETIAALVWKKLHQHDISAFLDKEELRLGENANEAMERAIETSPIGVFILSTEFAAKKWTMKELKGFLQRESDEKSHGGNPPLLIPVFYRMGLHEWQDQDLFRRSEFATWGFVERLEAGEASIKEVRENLKVLSRHTGIENLEGATNEPTEDMANRRKMLIDSIVARIVEAVQRIPQGIPTSPEHLTQSREGSDGPAEDAPPKAGEAAVLEEELNERFESLVGVGSRLQPVTEDDLYARFKRLLPRNDSRNAAPP